MNPDPSLYLKPIQSAHRPGEEAAARQDGPPAAPFVRGAEGHRLDPAQVTLRSALSGLLAAATEAVPLAHRRAAGYVGQQEGQ